MNEFIDKMATNQIRHQMKAGGIKPPSEKAMLTADLMLSLIHEIGGNAPAKIRPGDDGDIVVEWLSVRTSARMTFDSDGFTRVEII